jgi:hypothetical protein
VEKMKKLIISIGVLFIFLLSMSVQAGQPLGSGGSKDPRIAPPHSNAYGKSLEEWTVLYWTSYLTGGPDKVGPVYFLPLPGCDEYTPPDPPDNLYHICEGHLPDLTVKPGTPFMLPIFAWIMEYPNPETGECDDPLPDEVFTNAVAEVTINGREILTNIEDYYVSPVEFDPLIIYDEPHDGYIGACRVQGVAFLSMPLQPGVHEIENYVEFDWIEPGVGIIYDNTWTITVLPKGKNKN